MTLYAVWELAYTKPRITINSIARCDGDGNSSDNGTYACVDLTWKCDKNISTAKVTFESDSTDTITIDLPINGTVSGNVDKVIVGAGALSSEVTYTVKVTIADELGYTTEVVTLPGAKFIVDILAEGKGIAFNKPAELEGVADIGFQTRFFGGILHPVLEPETDLNDIRTPNTYVGANVSNYNYANCPLTTGTFTLEVVGMGEEGQVKQSLTYCHKTAARTWERIYYSSGWGEWVCVSDFDGQLLWSGGKYMTADHIEALSEPVSKQRSGIVLVFSAYEDGEKQNHHFECQFIPKTAVSAHPGAGYNFHFSTSDFSYIGTKYIYVSDEQIKGHANNNLTGTKNGITFANNHWVLRYVIGV